ncbi:Na+/H+ antiporter NhaC family protein [Anaeromassilibacillus senegalensis]|uniref:Na+/H+ antiporter NhaC family protein n=1 Tax=Anaeromassilibacillus senegalensis TaxID=1673717 RepID=A0ABS9CSZ2_9FIRM|nr:Na+/H+ antiporter NhaC family protein [Anaeromassilibacillus senegalensis]MCF2653237.1 Na+/H+ antiporter NhaC family protein [Anaeromassilibacillus senegalensis]
MGTTKTRRTAWLAVVIAVFAALVLLFTLGAGAFGAAEEADPEAWAYIDGYSENVDSDPAFDTNLGAALTSVRGEIHVYATWLALLPPVIAIVLALITKEVYSSLFIGILSGALLYANFGFTGTIDHLFVDGFIASIADSYNIGILLFLVVLGAIVVLMNRAGGSAAFGKWAVKHIKSRVGAQLATVLLGCLIFVDDYFNCLTVGSVMRPVTDKFKVSRAKLAYLIDSTAAPICIIAPVSSWAAAVAGFVPEGQSGFALFIRAIPFNFYALLTILAMVLIAVMKLDFGPMKRHEENALKGDLFSSDDAESFKSLENEDDSGKGSVWDLVAPVAVLIAACILGLIYSGGFFTPGAEGYGSFIVAFSAADASQGLVYGSFAGLIFAIVYFMLRGVLTFKQCMESIPEGFKAMVPAIMILSCAWTLKTMTDSLGAKIFIAEFVRNYTSAFITFLPAIVFLIAIGLSFSTGTSWGTFGILIPIVLAVFGTGALDMQICVISISACMAGAVCGDHCSPISDTTIMASAGSQSNHINHVSTQLPYAMTVAAVSFVAYAIAGFVQSAWIVLPIAAVLMVATLFGIRAVTKKRA